MSAIPSNFLPIEYQVALTHRNQIRDRLLLVGTTATLLCVGASAYVLGYRANLKLGYAWGAPGVFVISAAILLVLFAWWLSAQDEVTRLRQQAGFPTGGDEPNRFSFAALQKLVWLPAVGLVGLYLLTLLYGLRAIYTASRTAGTIFGLVYAGLTLMLVVAGWVVCKQRGRAEPFTIAEIRRFFLPYPDELLLGFGLLTGGFLAPLLTIGLSIVQFPVINALFSRNVEFTTHVPLAAVCALALAYLGVSEGLLIPAGRLWKEMRSGAAFPYGYQRIAAGVLVAFPLAFLLGGIPLLTLAGLIVIHQTLAGLWPVSGESPAHTRIRFHRLWDPMAIPLRFYAGVLVWVGPAWSFTIFLLLFCWAGFFALGLQAAHQARLARLQSIRGETPLAYDLTSTPLWQRAGFVAASLTAALLVMMQIAAENCDAFNYTLAAGYGMCRNGIVRYTLIGPLNGALLVFDLLLIGILACASLVHRLHKAGPRLIVLIERLRPLLPLFLVAAAGLGIASFGMAIPGLSLGGILILTVALAVWAER